MQDPRWQTHRDASNAVPDGLTVACVFIPYFPLRVEILRHPELDGLPLALTDLGQRRLVTSASPEAQAQGIRVGMPLREAVAACPQAAILTADPVSYANAFADLVRELSAVSPGIEPGEPGVAYVDLRGLARLYGGLDGVAAALVASVPTTYRPRIGLAGNKFVARVAAHWARPGSLRKVPADFSKAFLANCPTALLPVPEEMQRRLERFGLYELRDIARLPRAKLQAQFGATGRRIWELANGQDSEPLRPLSHEERVVARLTLPGPSVQHEMVLLGVQRLIEQLYARPELRHHGARQARLQLLIEGNRSWERTFMLKGVLADPRGLTVALFHRLASLALEGPVEEIVLELAGLTLIYARQEELFSSGAHVRQEASVREAVRQLKSRYEVSPVCRALRIEPWSRLPERRWGLLVWE